MPFVGCIETYVFTKHGWVIINSEIQGDAANGVGVRIVRHVMSGLGWAAGGGGGARGLGSGQRWLLRSLSIFVPCRRAVW